MPGASLEVALQSKRVNHELLRFARPDDAVLLVDVCMLDCFVSLLFRTYVAGLVGRWVSELVDLLVGGLMWVGVVALPPPVGLVWARPMFCVGVQEQNTCRNQCKIFSAKNGPS